MTFAVPAEDRAEWTGVLGGKFNSAELSAWLTCGFREFLDRVLYITGKKSH